jgi:ribosomal protein S18 acetylase RimI-like enzyme
MLVIRPARPADEPFLLALTERLGAFEVPPWRTPAEIAAADHHIVRGALQAPDWVSAMLVAETDAGERLGYVLVTAREDYFRRKPHAHVEVLALEPAAEGHGVGRRLMEAAEEWAARQGFPWITLNVFGANTRACGLYEHLGYQVETIHYLKLVEPPSGRT